MKTVKLLILSIILSGATYAQGFDYEVRDIDQQWTSLEDLKGEKLTIVDFWATWCKPCVTALPKLNTLAEEYKDKGVTFIGLNTDGPRNQAKVKPFVETMNISYPIVLDADKVVLNDMNVSVLPTLIIFDKKGKELFRHEGFSLGDEVLIAKEIDELLEK